MSMEGDCINATTRNKKNNKNNSNTNTIHDQDQDTKDEDARVILHFDLDAFYVACERELNPELRKVPVAVSQYNPYGKLEATAATDIHRRWIVKNKHQQQEQQEQQQQCDNTKNKTTTSSSTSSRSLQTGGDDSNGGLIAVSYEARAYGVKRNQRGREASQVCGNGLLNIVQVPVKHGKADLSMYRSASKKIMEALEQAVEKVAASSSILDQSTTAAAAVSSSSSNLLVEVASIDEVYMDVTVLVNRLVERLQHETQEERTTTTNPTAAATLPTQKLASAASSSLWASIVDVAGTCTTIGGVEVLSKAARAANSLGKEELRRGSHVQVLDSKDTTATTTTTTSSSGSSTCSTEAKRETTTVTQVDVGSRAWWQRDPSSTDFTTEQVRLACGAYLAAHARRSVTAAFADGTVYTLSAGIATNKTLAKLASAMKKPNRQTLIYRDDPAVLDQLFHPLPVGRIRGLGGKFGVAIADLFQIETVGQLADISLPTLQHALVARKDTKDGYKTAQFLYDISRGLCREVVTARNKPKSIECSKTFRGPLSIRVDDTTKLTKWVGELCNQLRERLQQDREAYHRMASLMKVSVKFEHGRRSTSNHHNSNTNNTNSYQRSSSSSLSTSSVSKQTRAPRNLDHYLGSAMGMIQELIAKNRDQDNTNTNLKIVGMGVGGTQFVEFAVGSSSILTAMKKQQQQCSALSSSSSSRSDTNASSTRLPIQKRSLASLKRKKVASGGMDQWLQQSKTKNNNTDDGNNGVGDTTDDRNNNIGIQTKKIVSQSLFPSQKDATTMETKTKIISGNGRNRNSDSSSSSPALSQYLQKPTNKAEKIQQRATPAAMSVPGMDEIDSDVFKSLPKDVQKAVLSDIKYQASRRTKCSSSKVTIGYTKIKKVARGGGGGDHGGKKRKNITSFFLPSTKR